MSQAPAPRPAPEPATAHLDAGSLPPPVAEAVDRIAAFVERLEAGDEAPAPAEVLDLLRDVDAIHRPGLRGLLRLAREAGLEAAALEDPGVRLLVELYDLAPGGELGRAEAALDALRPGIEAHGGRLELLEASEDAMRVRLSAAGVGAAELGQVARRVEQALVDRLPGIERVEVDPNPLPSAPANFVPLSSLQPRRGGVAWESALPADEVGERKVREAQLRGRSILVTRVDGEYFAYRNVCPDSTLPLTDGQVADGMLVCPWHGCRFDLRGGRRVGATGPGLGVIPVRVRDGVVHLGRLQAPGAGT